MKSGTMDKHRGSTLLKPEENEQVFQLIGNRCQCLAAGIIQLYLTESPLHKEWIKKTTGIITLIRDNPKRSFFLRLYCLQRKAMLWEHEVYNAMDYKAPLTYFHTFEAEDCMAAFNFASETDAVTLRNILLGKLNAKRQRRQQKRTKVEIESQHGATLPWGNQSNTSPIAFSTGSTSNLLNGTPTTVGVNRSASSSSMYKTKKKKRDKAKRKLTKDDIGPPSNFRHLSHLRYIESKGLEFEPDDPHLKIFLDKVGVSEYQFKNQDTRNFIYEFIEKNGGMNAIREDISISTSKPSTQQQPQQQPLPVAPQRQEYPPPVPARTIPHQTRSAPPLPPNRFNAPSTPPSAPANAPPVHRTLPSRPPPPSLTAVPSLPPPPPPPPPALAPPSRTNSIAPVPPPPPLPNLVNTDEGTFNTSAKNNNNNNTSNNNNEENADPHSMLMESIRSGTTLRKVDKSEIKQKEVPVPGDSRNALLEQIRQGVELRPVVNEVKPKTPPIFQGGLASALSRALAERSSAIHSESDESTSETSDDDEWDD
ncbi:neural Wiskott-Aldrich syndrome protein-like [Colletes gigas]|uniref:neural Wiskott-Aldrich syndrome protein-like n=1 Tax=Colletes gigas TaxID=935657 RepID=UPI001C9A5D78|nr:neural Wiskott-Aldrich syndrome protein-like [Colletes gigas]